MSCYNPLKGFIVGIKDNGKKDIKIRSYETDHVELLRNGQYIDRPSKDVLILGKPFYEFDTIPCGRCIGCRLQRAKSWADRAVLELPYHESNLFITLTYDDDHLPLSETVDENGEPLMVSTLVKEDLQLFWKRLRKYLYDEKKRSNPKITWSDAPKIRYLACGEYGSDKNTHRPHYHAIVFGLELPDLKFYTKNQTGDYLYTSDILNSIWKQGYCIVGEATHESIGYVARYVTKKKYGQDAEFYKRLNIIPEFLTMSRKPGIGREYYEEHKKDLFEKTRYFFPTRDGSGSAAPSRYFNDLFERDFDTESVLLRKNNLKAMYDNIIKSEMSKTDKNFLDYMATKDYTKNDQILALKRNVNL